MWSFWGPYKGQVLSSVPTRDYGSYFSCGSTLVTEWVAPVWCCCSRTCSCWTGPCRDPAVRTRPFQQHRSLTDSVRLSGVLFFFLILCREIEGEYKSLHTTEAGLSEFLEEKHLCNHRAPRDGVLPAIPEGPRLPGLSHSPQRSHRTFAAITSWCVFTILLHSISP